MKATSPFASPQHTAAILSSAQAIAFVADHGGAWETSRRGAIAWLADTPASDTQALAAPSLLAEIAGAA